MAWNIDMKKVTGWNVVTLDPLQLCITVADLESDIILFGEEARIMREKLSKLTSALKPNFKDGIHTK